MSAKEWIGKHGGFTLMLTLIIAGMVIVGSFVFDPPEHISGIVVEKIYVPPKTHMGQALPTIRKGGRTVALQSEEQWIAIVLTDAGDTLTVHCHPDHYGQKNVGDKIKFREYRGSLIHIDYFSHGDEEGENP